MFNEEMDESIRAQLVSFTGGWFAETAGGAASAACQEAVADLLGLIEQLQVLLSIFFREQQLRQLIFHEINHITCAVWGW